MTPRHAAALPTLALTGVLFISATPPGAGGGDLTGNAVVGDEFQVNTYTTGNQQQPAVSVDPAGNFVVVWQSEGSPDDDADGWSVQGQRFDSGAAPVSGQFQGNIGTAGAQTVPSIVGTAGGEFAVTWQSESSSGGDGSSTSVQFQRFDDIGHLVGSDFQVNTYTTAFQTSPSVAFSAGHGFVVVWQSNGSSGTDSAGTSIQGQRLDPAGLPIGTEFQVNDFTSSSQYRPVVALDAGGRFLVAWQNQIGSPDTSSAIRARAFDFTDASGIGAEFEVNSYTTSYQDNPAIADRGDGTFVVVWQSYGSSSDSSGYSIQGRLVDLAGPVGGQFQVNAWTTDSQAAPAVASDRKGNFVVAWSSYGSFGPDADQSSIQNRQYDSLARPFSAETQVNSAVFDSQRNPAIALGEKYALIAWEGAGADFGQDLTAIKARRIVLHPIFAGDFEVGDFCRWSEWTGGAPCE